MERKPIVYPRATPIADKDAKIGHLKAKLEQAYRLLSGKECEYTQADNALQGRLLEEEPVAAEPEEEPDEYTLVKRKRLGKKKPVREPVPAATTFDHGKAQSSQKGAGIVLLQVLVGKAQHGSMEEACVA